MWAVLGPTPSPPPPPPSPHPAPCPSCQLDTLDAVGEASYLVDKADEFVQILRLYEMYNELAAERTAEVWFGGVEGGGPGEDEFVQVLRLYEMWW